MSDLMSERFDGADNLGSCFLPTPRDSSFTKLLESHRTSTNFEENVSIYNKYTGMAKWRDP